MQRSGEGLDVSYPAAIVDAAEAGRMALRLGLDFSRSSRAWQLRGASLQSLKPFFSGLHGVPVYAEGAPPASADPLVSCIVVVNENLPFVREQLVPSLAAHAGGHALEVLFVLNGSARRGEPGTGAVSYLESPWGAVAAAYNAGARAARGGYLAFLHDDCVIDDPAWVDKCLGALEAGAGAVAGEFRRMEHIAGTAVPSLPVAKCVPLVMRRADFEACGGFDEFHYVGYEDLDLTLSLLERGMKVVAADIRLRHYGGMSSTLKYCPVPGLAELYALCAVPPAAIIRRFREFVQRGVRVGEIDLMRLGLDVQLLYVLRKYRAFLEKLHPSYARAASALERSIAKACPFDATLILPRFREMDRVLRPASA